MSNIKKKQGNSWKVLASGNATGISVENPKLLEDGESITSVDKVLAKHEENIAKLQRNVSWLALHGGGGSGGGSGSSGGSSSDLTEATCNITVNGTESGSPVYMGSEGLVITLNNINVKATKNWTVTVSIGAILVKSTSASFTSDSIYITYDEIAKYLTNHSGNLIVKAVYNDLDNFVFGSAQWTGAVYESTVELSTQNLSLSFEDLETAQYTYSYSVGIVGDYTLSLSIIKSNTTIATKEFPLTINSTQLQTKTINIKELLGVTDSSTKLELVGVYNIAARLSYNANPQIQASFENTITIISDDIMISTTKMSRDIGKPTEVALSGSLNVVFTAYLQNASTFRYKYSIGTEVIKEESSGYFGTEISDYIPVSNKSWATEGTTVPLIVTVTSGTKSETDTFYIKFVAASETFLEIDSSSKAHLVSEFLSREFSKGDSSFALSKAGYENGGNSYTIKSTLETKNGNNLSVISVLDNGMPYLRLSNGAYAVLKDWNFGTSNLTLQNLITTGQFTISICFKADYHPDDDRTILFLGNVDNSTGEMISGISIDAHDVYINNSSKLTIVDNTINMIDITCTKTLVSDTKPDGTSVQTEAYIIKIYQDGVLSAVDQESKFLTLGDNLYLGGRIYNTTTGDTKADYLCDCNIYNLQLYDTAITDFDVVVNYINNLVSTQYVNGSPKFSIINEELKKNFCERNSDGTINSYMFVNGQYSINFLLDASNNLSETNLNNYAKVLGIPIMLVDVSTDDQWTFNNFVTQQTAGAVSLPATSNKTIQYWDPQGSNTKVITINDATIELQGTSTLADAIKNINATIPDSTVFIPKDTWFPELTYTLKADVVDSSHSNNASIGNFINTVLGYNEEEGSSYYPFDPTAINAVYSSDYKKNQQSTVTLKHTVEGFPVLLIMKFNTNETSSIAVTPLGIYSFNLGRNAYRNLGFKKLNSVQSSTGDKPVIKNFPYVLENATFNEEELSANWIEIKDTTTLSDLESFTSELPEGFNSSKGDFWQNDDNILNNRYEVRYPANRQVSQYNNFKTFVGNIMLLPIEGTYDTDSMGVLNIPQVTDAYDLYTVDSFNNYSKTGNLQAIVTDANTLPTNLGFNAESMYKYFSIALLFGLVDNFGKNATFRSWNSGQYYIDFYDLDTAMGGGNQGQLDITPDTWIKYLANKKVDDKPYGYVGETYNKKEAESQTIVSANHNKLWMSLDTSFFRAYSNNSDVNSAYTLYWYNLRYTLSEYINKQGYKDFAEFFIDNYYTKQTKSCGPLLFNYDYKLKYLLQFTDDSYSNVKDLTKLHGRKISYARDWLKKHIIFLDSLFAWRDSNQARNFANNVDSKGSNTVYKSPDSFPMMSNTPIIMYNSVGNTTLTFYFMLRNTETYINAGGMGTTSALNWNFTNSPNIILFGNDDLPLSDMGVNILSYTNNAANWDTLGYPAITELNLSNNSNFGAGFNLNAFELGDISELRSLNFFNTSGTSFTLALNKTTSAGETYTKYTKLTSIDISNSKCVSNLDIPAIPLKELKVANSAITDFTLDGQRYLSNVDLSGCSKLLTVTLKECDGYTELNLSNLTNLTKVSVLDCANITKIVINNCPALLVVDIEECASLKSITINNCPALKGDTSTNYITILKCSALQSLDLSSNNNLVTFNISTSNQAGIKTLALQSTKIASITGDNVDTSLLDLSAFTSLSNFSIYDNSEVVKIQLANNQSTPIALTNTFQGCTNLERIFGNMILTNTSYSGNWGLFYNCSKFTIHGSSTTWKNGAIYSGGVVNTPWKILTGDGTNRGDAYSAITWNDGYLTGKGVTNIKFTNTGNVIYRLFEGTNISQFDIYYLLFVFALSDITVGQSAYRAFRGATSFDWTKGNLPDRYMFYKCSAITSLSETFISASPTFLYSPEDGKDNGLLSPLTKLQSFSAAFSGSIVFSKKLFNRTSGDYPLTSFSSNSVYLICDEDDGFSDYSNYSNNSWLIGKVSNVGNFDGFFDHIPYLSYLGSTFNSSYINYSSIKLPATVVDVNYCFNSSTGKGEIDLEEIFPENSACLSIAASFIVSGYNTLYGSKPTFPIKSTTFSHLKSLVTLGYNPNVYNGGSMTNTSFSGNGLRKYIYDDTFPTDLVSKLPALSIFAGFFKNVEAKSFATTPEIPGNMFVNNKNLTNVAALMMNTEFTYKLSSNGFANCPKLSNVAYFCYHDVSSTSRGKLIGEIPYKLFYHGHTVTSLEVKGTNQTSQPTESFDLSNLGSTTIQYNSYNKNITNMYRCFYGCVGIEAYTNEEGQEFIENNANYSPYKWVYNSNTKTWSERTSDKQLDGSWGYTGQPSTKTSGVSYLEDEDVSLVTNNTPKTETLNYCCAPDLLRYCTNSNSTDIRGLFENCGLNYSVGNSGYMTNEENYYTTGILGRIPPYLLNPVSAISSIRSIFKNCKRLSSYKDSAEAIYQIPKNFLSYTPKLTDLAEAFQGLSLIFNTRIDLFSYLTGTLDIRKIFASTVWGTDTEGGTWSIANLFTNNNFSKISGAFSYKDGDLTDSTASGVTLYTYNSIAIPANITMTNNFNASKIPSATNVWYVYCGWNSQASDSAIGTGNNNYSI